MEYSTATDLKQASLEQTQAVFQIYKICKENTTRRKSRTSIKPMFLESMDLSRIKETVTFMLTNRGE